MDFTLLFVVIVVHCLILCEYGVPVKVGFGIVEILVVTLLLELYLVLWSFQMF